MIICHKYQFIFLKTRKTAGSSVEIALSRLCDENDIVTTIAEEELRQEEGGRAGKNIPKSWYQYSPKDIAKLFLPLPNRKPEKSLLHNHVSAKRVKRYVSSEIWNNYLKITIERNPWDKAISHYYWAKGAKENYPSLSEHLRRLSEKHLHALSNWKIYTIRDCS
ncbi:MAG: hypothetical protein BRC33_08070 [Cyanobacteria bacterium SW_9_44_58]|nr:MAG: hypothetical protein BRC33_08070 [Cyanobacteria bacterium SW_9_44_58]